MDGYLSEMYNWVPKGVLFIILLYVLRFIANRLHEEIMTSFKAIKEDLKLMNNKFEIFDSKVNEINSKLHTVVSVEQHSKDLSRVNDEMRQLRDMIIRLEVR